jgi:putative transposase
MSLTQTPRSAGLHDLTLQITVNGTFKTELVTLHGPWRTRRQLELAIIEWIDWYNASRLHGEIGDIPPLEHEANWYRHNTLALAAGTH